jgi:putative ABC transport system permease protein
MRDRTDRDLDAEMQSHLALHIEDNLRSGMSPEEARRDALLKLGGIEQTKELVRERRSLPLFESLLQDLRFGFRTLRQNPGFSFIAILTLALGIGANTAIFSLINSVLLQPLPFRDPDRLVRVFSARGEFTRAPVSGEDYFDWQSQNRVFEKTSLLTGPRNFNASGAGESETVSVVSTQANFFSTLGVPPELGREFAEGEDQPGNNHVAILSYGFCQRHFGGIENAIGKTLSLDFQPYTVVGVMPPKFNYPEATELWVPLEMAVDHLGKRGDYSYRVLGRMKPGVTRALAQADMTAVTRHLQEQFPVNNSKLGANVVPLKDLVTGTSRPQLLILLGAVALVLLVACANVANLLLARATGRQREIALRAALGATRWRLVRQLFTESVMLSTAGALLGLAGAWWLIRFAQSVRTLPIPRQNPIQLDATVLLFTLAVSVLVGILFGLAPALEASRLNLNEQLKTSTGAVASVSGWRLALRNALVVGEIATSLALLAGAGLLLRSFAQMRSADIGVRTQNILTAAVVLPEAKYETISARRQFYQQLLDRVGHAPGVTAAALSQQIPLEGSHGGNAKLPGDTDPKSNGLPVNWNFVTSGYFRVFGIRFLSGREFTPQELDQAAEFGAKFREAAKSGLPPNPQVSSVAVINRTMARALWPDQDAVGKIFISSLNQPISVAGVVGDERYESFRGPVAPEVYFPFTRELNNKWYPAEIVALSSGPPEGLVAGIRAAVHDLDSELSLFRVRSMQQVIAENMQDTTLQTALLSTFAGLGLVLSAVGIYGVMAYLVTQRTREIGLRMALGAQQRDVLRLVLGRGVKLTVAGVTVGAASALALTRLLATQLFGVTATDPLTFVGVSLLLTAVALAACLIPARRAMRVDPLVALRYE